MVVLDSPSTTIPFALIRCAMCSCCWCAFVFRALLLSAARVWIRLLNIFCAKRHENLKHLIIVIQQANVIQVRFHLFQFILRKTQMLIGSFLVRFRFMCLYSFVCVSLPLCECVCLFWLRYRCHRLCLCFCHRVFYSLSVDFSIELSDHFFFSLHFLSLLALYLVFLRCVCVSFRKIKYTRTYTLL